MNKLTADRLLYRICQHWFGFMEAPSGSGSESYHDSRLDEGHKRLSQLYGGDKRMPHYWAWPNKRIARYCGREGT